MMAGRGVLFGLSVLTILPVGRIEGTVDRGAARTAMSIAPGVGAVVGFAAGAVGLGAHALGASPLVSAVLVVAAGVGLTRGLHVDGLADTVDGLGSYRDADGALAIMRRPDIGPFGVAAVVLNLLAQTAAVAVLLGRPWYAALLGIGAAHAAGRLAIAVGCRRGVPAARPDGLGALVAGTVGPYALIVGAVGVAALAVPVVPGRPWQGPLAVGVSMVLVWAFRRHIIRRLGGVTGDVLGALCELGTVATYVVASM